MKRLALLLLALAAGLAVNSARAGDLAIRATVNVGAPGYATPVQYNGYGYGYGYTAPGGYWRTVSTRVWVPGHWDVSYDGYGRQFSHWDPGHYEMQNRQVWVSYPRYDWRDHERHERHEWWEQQQREHEWREHRYGDRDDDRR